MKRSGFKAIYHASLIVMIWALFCQEQSIAQQQKQLAESDQCLSCHLEDENLPEDFQKYDVHMQAGISCSACHGGDPDSDDDEIAMSAEAGYIGIPPAPAIPKLCGRCHSDINFMRKYQPRIATDQIVQYNTSVHGIKLQEGDDKVATCASCHTAHAILSASDPRSTVYALNVPETCRSCHSDEKYMSEYDIPTSQFEDFANGVHGKALLEDHDVGAPACNDCHGNHGATPPGVTAINRVCGTCHLNNLNLFSTSKMAEEFVAEETHGCEECHGNHAVARAVDDMVGTREGSVCLDCHEEGDEGYRSAALIRQHLANYSSSYDSATTIQSEVRRIGMDDIDIAFLLQESHHTLIQARTLVHTFDEQKVGVKTAEGIAKSREAMQLAYAEIEAHRVRQQGFGAATLFISILAVALFLKIRELEMNGKQ